MYVIDLLKELNPQDIINELDKIPYFFEYVDIDNKLSKEDKILIKKNIKQKYLDELLKILNKEDIVFNDNEILAISPRIGGDENNALDCYTINLNEKDKLLKSLKMTNFEDVFNFKNPTKDICFLERKYILGFKVSNINMKRYGKLTLATNILKALTTFAIDECERNCKTNEIIGSIINQTKELEKSEKTYTMKELREILGIQDNRTNIEKCRERYISYCDIYKSILQFIFDVQEILVEENIINDTFNGIEDD